VAFVVVSHNTSCIVREPMSSERYRTEPPPPSRAALVLGLYGALALGALLVSAGRGDADIYRLDETVPSWHLLVSVVFGVVLGLGVVALSRLAVTRTSWGRDLHQSFRHVLGPLTGREIAILAAASAVGEELIFRGALLPWIGLVPQAILFALLHIGPTRRYLPWTVSALLLGLAFGLVARLTGDLGGPIVAHFTINFVNLRYIARVELVPLSLRTAEPVEP
jgi:membrane protease YdiL (CAAX protease family)